MRIYVQIGPDAAATNRMQHVLADKRDQLLSKGVLFARGPGIRNHTRAYMACSQVVDVLRFNRGFASLEKQRELRSDVAKRLAAEVDSHRPRALIVSAHQFGTGLTRQSELQHLHDILRPLSDDIRILAHIEDPARMLLRQYAAQIIEGRTASLDLEMRLAGADSWWDAAAAACPAADPEKSAFEDVQGAPRWLDYERLAAEWDAVFGAGALRFRSLDMDVINSPAVTDEICASFDIDDQIGRAGAHNPAALPSDAWLARSRQMNVALMAYVARKGALIPRKLWRQMLVDTRVAGAAPEAGSLSRISDRFSHANQRLAKAHDGLTDKVFITAPVQPDWQEADPTMGFRATQYLMAFRPRINRASKEAKAERVPEMPEAKAIETLPASARDLPVLAQENLIRLQNSSFAPHNRLGLVNEEALAAAFAPMPPRQLEKGSSGNVIVGCMKNEAPYIIEWIAYHRAIGIDTFLIYTNACDDGTDALLNRLQAMGIVQHRNNDDWKGKSPQQHALNAALKEPVIKNADWIVHIDVDEFMNVRCGNGTLDDFFAEVPDATNVAMTWRMFGHNGVTRLADDLVIDQFDTCAPKFCPKPHTVWGFKTMIRNIGAYEKLSCHRPNKLKPAKAADVNWVNGSGQDMTSEARDNGWRNSRKSIGYDLLQLNHYALRSAESFLIKRQRGRALHVDRSIGLNYWIRMDWSDFRDITIKRNIPRVRAEMDRLLADPKLRALHDTGLDWHRAKALELHKMPEFADLYAQATALRLTENERVAYALALDMES